MSSLVRLGDDVAPDAAETSTIAHATLLTLSRMEGLPIRTTNTLPRRMHLLRPSALAILTLPRIITIMDRRLPPEATTSLEATISPAATISLAATSRPVVMSRPVATSRPVVTMVAVADKTPILNSTIRLNGKSRRRLRL